jgi:hypothetical protein
MPRRTFQSARRRSRYARKARRSLPPRSERSDDGRQISIQRRSATFATCIGAVSWIVARDLKPRDEGGLSALLLETLALEPLADRSELRIGARLSRAGELELRSLRRSRARGDARAVRQNCSNADRPNHGYPTGELSRTVSATSTKPAIVVIGDGRLGPILAAVLGANRPLRRGAPLPPTATAVILAVPDREIAPLAASIPVGPAVGHCSGALTLDVLAPHKERFSMHPLMTITERSGSDALRGAGAAIAGSSTGSLALARELAIRVGLEPFEIRDEDRALYHAAGGCPVARGTCRRSLLPRPLWLGACAAIRQRSKEEPP